MNSSYAVIRAIGTDRVGIVEDLTTLVEEFSCNIEESKMSVLGGEFAVMMLVSAEAAQIELLRGHCSEGSPFADLQVDVIPTDVQSRSPGVPYRIDTLSLDSPGIVHAVTSLLAREQINIEELDTDTLSAPFTGSPMFSMRIRINLSGPKQAADLEERLFGLGYDRDLDIQFSSIAAAE